MDSEESFRDMQVPDRGEFGGSASKGADWEDGLVKVGGADRRHAGRPKAGVRAGDIHHISTPEAVQGGRRDTRGRRPEKCGAVKHQDQSEDHAARALTSHLIFAIVRRVIGRRARVALEDRRDDAAISHHARSNEPDLRGA